MAVVPMISAKGKTMASLSSSVSSTHIYRGDSEINFFLNEQGELSVTIDTERLHIRSVASTEADYDRYGALFGDQDAVNLFAVGATKTRAEIQARIDNVWVKRWKGNDPYAGLAIFKRDTDDFLGHVVLGHGDEAGEAEIAGLSSRVNWRKGYGSEVGRLLVNEYAPATVQEGYTIEGKPLERIAATASPSNPASCRILEKLGMKIVRVEEKYGSLRHHYSINLAELQEK
jgi:ribosomal-protein-alanine N-acetyltransferase